MPMPDRFRVSEFARQHKGWTSISLLSAACVVLPILSVFWNGLRPANENWAHIRRHMLWDHVPPTIRLVVFACAASAMLGAALAWLVAAYDFPLRRLFRWALALPLAVPPYIAAYTYGNMLSYTGIVQQTLRGMGVRANPAWFDIMSEPGAVFIFTMFLYPYVFLITRAYLEKSGGSYVENARLLGRSGLPLFFRVVLPISRPALAGGAALVAYETLSDYGVVNYYGIQTLTIAIFKTWFGMYDIESATRLGALFLAGILAVVVLERLLRRRRRYSETTGRGAPLKPVRLRGAKAALATAACLAALAVAFLIPVAQLAQWAGWTFDSVALRADFGKLAVNTLKASLLATALILAVSVIVANTVRMARSGLHAAIAKLLTAGYAIPGPIIAIGVLSLFIALDRLLAPLYAGMGRGAAPLVLSLSLAMLIAGYVVRFMATGYNAVESGFERIGMKYAEASRTLGAGPTRTFFAVDLPMIRGPLLGGAALTFVEIAKELPLTMLLRPFNFDTLATKAYQYAGDERIYQAAAPSLMIIGIGLASVFILHHMAGSGQK
ncbi:MAG: iron ABC transporter [Paenibacillaceae bacterium]|nr:MAG: iron ABC transporter [Paenibacillaceae bacterium]